LELLGQNFGSHNEKRTIILWARGCGKTYCMACMAIAHFLRSIILEAIYFDELIKETEIAWLVKIDKEEIWFPKSQCELDEDDKKVEVPEWLAIEKGLV